MFTFWLIFLTWIVPGIVLFLYLSWLSMKFRPKRDELDESKGQSDGLESAETDLFADEAIQPDGSVSSEAKRREKKSLS